MGKNSCRCWGIIVVVVHAVPTAWLGALEEAVLEWRGVQDALNELVSINVALLDLKRTERSLKKKRTSANAQNKKA